MLPMIILSQLNVAMSCHCYRSFRVVKLLYSFRNAIS